LTSHRVTRRPGQPLPQRTDSGSTDLIHVNAIPGQEDRIPALTLLQAFGAVSGEPTYRARYLAILDQLEKSDPDNVIVLSALAWKNLADESPQGRSRALPFLSRAVEKHSRTPADYESLAQLLSASGQLEDAVVALKRGIAVDPFHQRFYKALALLYIQQQKYDRALEAMRSELELFPEDTFMRTLLKRVETSPNP
jgi:tetratricopeptide (TPR) repeat protein